MISPYQQPQPQVIDVGDRVKAYFLNLFLILGPAVLLFFSVILTLMTPFWVGAVGLTNFILIFAANTNNIGGRIFKIEYVDAQTGQHRPGMLFLKLFVQNLFVGLSLGITLIVQFATYRDGQHFVDRMFNMVAVARGTAGSAPPLGGAMMQPGIQQTPQLAGQQPAQLPPVQPQQPLGQNRVQSVSMPTASTPATSQPAVRPTQNETAATPWSSGPAQPSQQPSQGTPGASQQQAFGQPPASFGSQGQPSPGQQAFGQPGQFGQQPANPPSQLSGPPTPPLPPEGGIVSSSPFAPKGQAPIPPKAAESPAPVAEVPATSLEDHTVLDEDAIDPEAVLALSLDDGTTITVDGPIALGRNPEHDDAKPIIVVDESMKLSKTHLLITSEAGQLHVEDLNSRNGVHVEQNGERVRIGSGKAVPLSRGATVYFGGRSFTV